MTFHPFHAAVAMPSVIVSSLTWWRPAGYLFVFLGMVLEGDAVLFMAFFLARQGFFDFFDLFFIVWGGVLFGDILWYRLGEWLQKSSSFFERWAERVARPFDTHLTNRPLRTIFLSKFVYGVHHALLMRAGALGIPVKTFLRNDFISSFLWICIVGGLGYFFSASFGFIRHYLRFAEGTLLLALLLFFALWHFVSWISKKEL